MRKLLTVLVVLIGFSAPAWAGVKLCDAAMVAAGICNTAGARQVISCGFNIDKFPEVRAAIERVAGLWDAGAFICTQAAVDAGRCPLAQKDNIMLLCTAPLAARGWCNAQDQLVRHAQAVRCNAQRVTDGYCSAAEQGRDVMNANFITDYVKEHLLLMWRIDGRLSAEEAARAVADGRTLPAGE